MIEVEAFSSWSVCPSTGVSNVHKVEDYRSLTKNTCSNVFFWLGNPSPLCLPRYIDIDVTHDKYSSLHIMQATNKAKCYTVLKSYTAIYCSIL